MTTSRESVEIALAKIPESRRGFFRTLLAGSVTAASITLVPIEGVAQAAKGKNKYTKKKIKPKNPGKSGG